MQHSAFLRRIIYHWSFIIVFATAFSILYHGSNFGKIDQAFYVPYLKSLADGSLYPNDIFISTWKEVYFASLWNILAIANKFVPLEPLFFVLHIFFRALFFLAVYLLSLQIFRNKNVAYLSVILWFIPKPSVGFNIFFSEFVQSEVALSFLLFSILFFLKNRYILSFIILGLTFHVHPPMSGFVFVGFLFYHLYRKQLKYVFLLFAIVFVVAFPIIIPTLIFAKNKVGYDEQWITLMRIRSPQHSFILSWSKEIWISFLSFVGLFFVSLRSIRDKIITEEYRKIYFLIFFLLFIIMDGFIFSEIFPVPEIIVTVPYHISSIFAVLASLFVIYFIYRLSINNSLRIRMLGYALFLIVFFSNFILKINQSQIILVAEFLLAALLIGKILKLKDIIKKNFLYITIFLLTIGLLWMPFLIRSNITRVEPRYDAWVDVQKWSNKNTDKSSIFIVPTYEVGFRVYSERTIVVDWIDGATGYLSPEFMKDWWGRMKDFGLTTRHYDKLNRKKLYSQISEDRVKKLAKKYNASYFVTEKKVNYMFSRVYSNEYFIIYKL